MNDDRRGINLAMSETI